MFDEFLFFFRYLKIAISYKVKKLIMSFFPHYQLCKFSFYYINFFSITFHIQIYILIFLQILILHSIQHSNKLKYVYVFNSDNRINTLGVSALSVISFFIQITLCHLFNLYPHKLCFPTVV